MTALSSPSAPRTLRAALYYAARDHAERERLDREIVGLAAGGVS